MSCAALHSEVRTQPIVRSGLATAARAAVVSVSLALYSPVVSRFLVSLAAHVYVGRGGDVDHVKVAPHHLHDAVAAVLEAREVDEVGLELGGRVRLRAPGVAKEQLWSSCEQYLARLGE